MKKGLIYTLLICSVLPCSAFADSRIKTINNKVAAIEKRIKQDNIPKIVLKYDLGENEGSPPEAFYYYDWKTKKLIVVKIHVGHEVFGIDHSYYFENDHILKYLKTYSNHPQNPPRSAIIYADDGTVLWKNMDAPAISAGAILESFKQNNILLNSFS